VFFSYFFVSSKSDDDEHRKFAKVMLVLCFFVFFFAGFGNGTTTGDVMNDGGSWGGKLELGLGRQHPDSYKNMKLLKQLGCFSYQ
jgi:hypothetical protein